MMMGLKYQIMCSSSLDSMLQVRHCTFQACLYQGCYLAPVPACCCCCCCSAAAALCVCLWCMHSREDAPSLKLLQPLAFTSGMRCICDVLDLCERNLLLFSKRACLLCPRWLQVCMLHLQQVKATLRASSETTLAQNLIGNMEQLLTQHYRCACHLACACCSCSDSWLLDPSVPCGMVRQWTSCVTYPFVPGCMQGYEHGHAASCASNPAALLPRTKGQGFAFLAGAS